MALVSTDNCQIVLVEGEVVLDWGDHQGGRWFKVCVEKVLFIFKIDITVVFVERRAV